MGRNLSISLGGDVALKRAQGAPQRPYSGSLGFPGASTTGPGSDRGIPSVVYQGLAPYGRSLAGYFSLSRLPGWVPRVQPELAARTVLDSLHSWACWELGGGGR